MKPSQAIAHYRVTAKIGVGGMGEVWRATDTRLHRDVAIKIIPESFAADADRMARFERESRVLASLNHPNIAAIYGVEERALVMELVEGPTLAERIDAGPMPLDEALPVARQIADALEYAHERGVVHRDLKPANVKITAEGRVKVLDFGLAKAMGGETGAGDPNASPTVTANATFAGVLLGTPAYMSPEQARGQPVDRRADVWAFGATLFEMVTGHTLFRAGSVSDTLARVLTGEIDLQPLPPEVRPVVERCLRRDPKLRWRSIGDALFALEEMRALPAQPAPRGTALAWTAAAVLALAAAAGWWMWWRGAPPVDRPLTRLNVDLGSNAVTGLNLTAAISPDGRRLVFPARGPDGKQQLATRMLDQAQPALLPDTEGASFPFFSPDGQWIGFFAGGQLKKIAVNGGAAVRVCVLGTAGEGGSWGGDGYIVLGVGPAAPLSRVRDSGGELQLLTQLGPGELTQRWPQALPGGIILFTASASASAMENANIEAFSVKTGQVKIVQRGGYFGRYLPGGHLVYVHQGTLFGVPFDLGRLEERGTPVPLLNDVAANAATGGGQFEFSGAGSGSGTFLYSAGKSAAQEWQMDWLDGSGKTQPLISKPGAYSTPRISPDGRKVAFIGESSDIYILDERSDTTSRLTFTGHANVPVWAPDGKHIAFASAGAGVLWVRSDGGGDPQTLLTDANSATPWSFSPDGRQLAYFSRPSAKGLDIGTLPLDLTDPDHPKPGKSQPFLQTPADENIPRFSPDGRWIAYRSNESGNSEIYVRPYPANSGGKWQISSGGGLYPFWSNNGRELFYETSDNEIMVLDYTVDGDSFSHGKPRMWSEVPLFYTGTSNIDLAPDGKRFVVFTLPQTPPGDKGTVHVTMLFNFFDELRRRLPLH